MEARAQVTHVRMSPRKVKVVLDLIRNKPVDVALAITQHTPKAACEPVEKLIKSAAANAENNHKRVRPRAQGRAFHIEKRTSHITLVLKEKE